MSVPYIDFDDPAPLLPLDMDESDGLDSSREIVQQGTDEWKQMRCGCITGSRISAISPKEDATTHEKYLYTLAIERLTNTPAPEGFKSARMQQGNDVEPQARALYELLNDVDVVQTDFIRHPTIPWFGVSPDGLVGNKGGLELKNRDRHIHLKLLRTKKPPRDAMLQMYALMSCANLDWVDYVSYQPDLPPRLTMITVRVPRDEGQIQVLEKSVLAFSKQVDELCDELRAI
jgi:hypothetical protein